jgi:ankyrin repeat protein
MGMKPCAWLLASCLAMGVMGCLPSQNAFDSVRRGDLKKVMRLLEADAHQIQVRDPASDHTLLDVAAANNRFDVAVLLLERGADVHAAGRHGTALHAAASQGHVALMTLLLNHGADARSQSEEGRHSPLHLASLGRGHLDAVRLLLAKRADVDARDARGRTPLHRAHDREVVTLLLAHRADVLARDQEGWTCLHWAALPQEIYALDTQKLLLAHGADPTLRDAKGYTAAQWARHSAKPELVELLEAAVKTRGVR